MSATAVALLLFAGWSMVLVALLAVYRTIASQSQNKPTNSFSPTGEDLPGLGHRITRAHANTFEFLPVAGAVMLVAIALDKTGLTDGLAYVFLGARLLQSLVHIASTAAVAVFLRFGFFVVQVAILFYWIMLMLVE